MKKSINFEALIALDIAIALALIVSIILEVIIFPNINPLLLVSASSLTFAIIMVIYILFMVYKKQKMMK